MKLAPGPPGGSREFLAELRSKGWPDPVELWNRLAEGSGVRLIEENITDISVISDGREMFSEYLKNELRIETEIFPGSSKFVFRMSFRVSVGSVLRSHTSSTGFGNIEDVQVGEFGVDSNAMYTLNPHGEMRTIYTDEKWYDLVTKKTRSIFSTIPDLKTLTPSEYKIYEEARSHFEWDELDEWTPPTAEDMDFHMPTLPSSGRGAALRRDIEKANEAKRDASRKNVKKCAPALDADNRIVCPCRAEPHALWCSSSDMMVKNPTTLTTLSHRIDLSTPPLYKKMTGLLPWTHGYLDLPVSFERVIYEGDIIPGRVNISETYSQLSIEVAASRGESLWNACEMYLSYNLAKLDMMFIGDYIQELKREVGGTDRISAYKIVPFKQCPDKRHLVSEDRLMIVKVLAALECGTEEVDIILSEAWSITNIKKCSICAAKKFSVPREDLI